MFIIPPSGNTKLSIMVTFDMNWTSKLKINQYEILL
jgi:hypothetical protein